MKILFKYPSRSRPERFFDGLDSIYNNVTDTKNFHISCTIDTDDTTMSNLITVARIMGYDNISVDSGHSESKIHAINRDMPDYDWDILVAWSDDMRATFYGFDQIIRDYMRKDLDTFLHLPDHDEKEIATLYVAGRPFYERLGHIYDPAYKSLFCDVELMEIAKEMGKYKFCDVPGLFRHLLPAYGHLPPDQMWEDQQRIGWTEDQKTYLERKAKRLSNPNVLNDWIDAYKNDSL